MIKILMKDNEDTIKIWRVRLIRFQMTVFKEEPTQAAMLYFSSKQKAEKWLAGHGFVYGKDPLLKDTKELYWFHMKDMVGDGISVSLDKIDIDIEETGDEWFSLLNLMYNRGFLQDTNRSLEERGKDTVKLPFWEYCDF